MEILRKWPVIELIILGIVLAIIVPSWVGVKTPDNMKVHQERQIALTTIQGACNSSITGVSILLASIAAVIGIRKELAPKAKDHFRVAAFFCVISLLAGVWNMGTLPQFVQHNVAYKISVGIVMIIQIYMLLLAGIRMLFAICRTIN